MSTPVKVTVKEGTEPFEADPLVLPFERVLVAANAPHARVSRSDADELERKLRRIDRKSPEAHWEADALLLAKLVHKRWGDQAAEVLRSAASIAELNAGIWRR